jgi:hypothetical protein
MTMGLKPPRWDNLPRQSKLAAVMYPKLVPQSLQQEVVALAMNEGKQEQLKNRIAGDAGAAMRKPNWFDPQSAKRSK